MSSSSVVDQEGKMTAPSASSKAADAAAVLDEVTSWIRDERKCVSVTCISQSFQGISRTKAASLLEQIACAATKDAQQQHRYQATYCQVEQQQQQEQQQGEKDDSVVSAVPTTVFCLVKDDWKTVVDDDEGAAPTPAAAKKMPSGGRTLYALALRPPAAKGLEAENDDEPENLVVAHERDAATRRDMIQDGNVTTLLDKRSRLDVIALSEHLEGLYDECVLGGRKTQLTTTRQQPIEEHGSSSSKASSSGTAARGGAFRGGAAGKKPTTTAASFFGPRNTKKASAGKKSSAADASSGSTAAVASRTAAGGGGIRPPVRTGSKNEGVTKSKKPASRSRQPAIGGGGRKKANDDNDVDNQNASSARSDGKENDVGATIGNADDFVGDMDDEDDESGDDDAMDVDGEDKPKQKAKPGVGRGGKVVSNRKAADDDDHSERCADDISVEEDTPKVTGAIDAFTTTKGDDNKQKKRRKVMKKERFVDEKGYFRTTMVEVWEDVPSDEEVQVAETKKNMPSSAASRPAAKKKKTAAGGKHTMKQGSITGFFSKKK